MKYLPKESVYSSCFLDCLREHVCKWSISLYDPENGGFRHNPQTASNVMSTTDIIWMRYAISAPDIGAPDRDRIVAYLQTKQDPATGKIRHDSDTGGRKLCDGHAFWQTVRALRILGADLCWFPDHLEPLFNASGLAAWFDSFVWSGSSNKPRGNHHEVLGIIPAIASIGDEDLTNTLLQKINEQQNSASGTWPREYTNISRTFAYSAIHLAAGQLPLRAEGIVDEILRLQTNQGLWDDTLPYFHTMDAAYLLVRLPQLIGYRRNDAEKSLQKLSKVMKSIFLRKQKEIMRDTHRTLAVVHTFGLLQEIMREEYQSEYPYRFDWDELDMFVCKPLFDRAIRSSGQSL